MSSCCIPRRGEQEPYSQVSVLDRPSATWTAARIRTCTDLSHMVKILEVTFGFFQFVVSRQCLCRASRYGPVPRRTEAEAAVGESLDLVPAQRQHFAGVEHPFAHHADQGDLQEPPPPGLKYRLPPTRWVEPGEAGSPLDSLQHIGGYWQLAGHAGMLQSVPGRVNILPILFTFSEKRRPARGGLS